MVLPLYMLMISHCGKQLDIEATKNTYTTYPQTSWLAHGQKATLKIQKHLQINDREEIEEFLDSPNQLSAKLTAGFHKLIIS